MESHHSFSTGTDIDVEITCDTKEGCAIHFDNDIVINLPGIDSAIRLGAMIERKARELVCKMREANIDKQRKLFKEAQKPDRQMIDQTLERR